MQLVLGAAGAFIGSFGGPTGAAWGWAIGSAIGGIIAAPRTHAQGPRLQDLTLTDSSYGKALPLVHGTAAVGGNIIWAAPKQEHANTQSAGGKGGGSTYTTFTYTRSYVVAICQGPIAGVRRIWANEKLIYDMSADALPAAIAGTQQIAPKILIYLGTAAQQPSELIEAHEGAGNVPGYRGVALAELTDFDLAPFNNFEPNLKFEVVVDGTLEAPTLIRTYSSYTSTTGTATAVLNEPNAAILDGGAIHLQQADDYAGGLTGAVRSVISATADEVLTNAYPVTVTLTQPLGVRNFNPHQVRNDPAIRAIAVAEFDEYGQPIAGTDDIFFAVPAGHDSRTGFTSAGVWVGTPGPWVALTLSDGIRYVFQCPLRQNQTGGNQTQIMVRVGSSELSAGRAVEANRFAATPMPAGLVFQGTQGGIETPYVAADQERKWIIARPTQATTDRILVIDAETMTLRSVFQGFGDPIAASNGRVACTIFNPSLQQTRLHVFDVSEAGGTIASPLTAPEVGTTAPLMTTGNDFYNAPAPGPGLVLMDTQLWRYTDTLTPAAPTLQEIVERICVAAGYSLLEVDAADLAPITVQGYVRHERMTGAAQLGMLAAAYSFDIAEIDGRVVARRRGAAADAVIARDDLLWIDGNPGIASTRAQESELPQKLDLSYLSQDGDYTVGAQSAQRIVTESAQQTAVDIPVVLADGDAAAMTARMLWEAWIARMRRGFALGPKWSALTPSDVVTLPLPDGGAATVRLTSVKRDGIRLVCEAVDVDAAAFTQPGVGGAVGGAGSALLVAQTTELLLADVPSLRDADDSLGIYAGVSALPGEWPGAALFVEPSTGAAAVQAGAASARATIGHTATALADSVCGDGHIDGASTVEVDLLYGDLPATITTDQQLGSAANSFLIGAEIVQARTVTLLGGRRVRLSNLIRGLKGTAAGKASHAVGEPVIQLDARLSGIDYEQSWIGNDATVVAVTRGKPYSSGRRRAIELTGGRLRPLPPAQVRAIRTAARDIVIAWHRRARLHASWQGYADVPLDEPSEKYEIDILDDAGAVVRTIASAADSVTYTAAQMLADFGSSAFSLLRLRVYQISARVGRGTPAELTLDVTGKWTRLLLHYDGPTGSPIVDAGGRAFTASSNAFIVRDGEGGGAGGPPVFGDATLYVGGSGHYTRTPVAAADQITGEFTVDFWYSQRDYPQASGATIFRTRDSNSYAGIAILQTGSNSLGLYMSTSGSAWELSAPDKVPLAFNTWKHIEVSRDANNVVRIFGNGVLAYQATLAGTLYHVPGDYIAIGGLSPGGFSVTANIDELRFMTACAHTSNFTPPTAPYTYA